MASPFEALSVPARNWRNAPGAVQDADRKALTTRELEVFELLGKGLRHGRIGL